ncbi:MAG: hypothetical protein ACJ8GW_02265, partial [Massilia sp.]
GPVDKAVELRFLLGFALKRADDAFYLPPSGEAAEEAYSDQRMARYRAWTAKAGPLVQRCLAADAGSLQVHFLYQDLFFGAREQGMEELNMLRLISELGAALEQHASPARAIVGPADVDDMMVLRVSLVDASGSELAHADKPLDLGADLQAEVDDVCDALATLGIHEVAVALRFGDDEQPVEVAPYAGADA